MSKDMMNIDDFVREKLNGHSEKEDPVAWLKMKDLLDKEMPERVAPLMFRFTKPMAMLGAALLIGVLCVGGYKLSALRDKGVPVENSTINTTNKSNNNNNRPAPQPYQAENQIENHSEEQNPITTSESNQENRNNSLANNSNASQTGAKIANNKIETAASGDFSISSKSRETSSDSKSVQQKENTKSSATVANKLTASSNASAPIASKESKNNSAQKFSASTKSNSNKQTDEQNDNTQSANVKPQKLTTEKLALASSKTTNSNSAKIVPSKLDIEKATENSLDGNKSAETKSNLANNGDNKDADKTNAKQSLVKDSMPAITVVSKTTISKTFPKHPINKLDTVDMGKVPYLAENNQKSQAAPNNKNTKPSPAATANIQAKVPENQLASKAPAVKNSTTNNAATNAGKQKKPIANWFSNLNLPEAIADAKKDLKNADFFFGFSAGGNYSFSNNNSFQGVQFGPTGELVFNKHWSLFGAIKYFNRSGGKKTVNDNFSKEFTKTGMPDSTIGANNYFTIYSDSTNRYFNFSTLHSFELPLTVRYTINKFYALTGINMAYYLNLNVEQVDKEYNAVNPYTIATNSTKPILRESTSKLKSSDFGSRFAMGWVLGAGYQITPAWQVDLRLVNPFWDNAQTTGAKTISKDFYKIPSVQISIGYQFGRVNSRPTFGPNSNNP